MQINSKVESFVLHFGEMGSRWGFNRTVGQILALLVLTPDALTADQLASGLKISRGNVSMAVKELQSWQLIRVSHQPGDRKDYYSPAGSFWDLAKTVFEQRKLREVDPTMSLLRDFLIDGDNEDSDEFVQQQIRELHDLLELLTSWGDQLNGLSADQLKRLMTLGSGVGKILDLKDKLVKVVSSDE
jgi:DNA-binding transcriptional regulator GbsR (MarR family)